MASHAPKQYPPIKGLRWHRDQYYSFFIPDDWYQCDWSDDRTGVIYAPEETDLQTVFAVDIKDLGTRIEPEDLDVLAEAFFESIHQLPQAALESQGQRVAGRQLELEAKYTFEEQGQTRKRWVRVFYLGQWQIAMTAQGATPEKYQYWLPWFFQAMMTAKVHYSKPNLNIFG